MDEVNEVEEANVQDSVHHANDTEGNQDEESEHLKDQAGNQGECCMANGFRIYGDVWNQT